MSKAFLARHGKTVIWTIAISILSGLSLLQALPKITAALKSNKEFLAIAMVGRFRPNELPAEILDKLSLGLISIDESGRAIPGLAKSWTVSEDGKTYIFNLDRSKEWHDGSEVTSKDISISIEHVQAEISDVGTIKFTLEEPYAPFPTVLAKPIFKQRLIGTGDFRLKKLNLNGEFVDSISIQNGKSGETYRFYPSSADAVTALKLGEVSEVRNLVTLEDVPEWPQFEIKSEKHPDRYLAVIFNTKINCWLKNQSGRRCLTL